MTLAPAIMVQGTASSVGKSLIATALCRRFRQDGLRVVPFKAQNMALNAAVTPLGGEIGRAQAAQAEAAGVLASVDMNPILLKPEGDRTSQVIVLGEPQGRMSATEYHAHKPALRQVVAAALGRLRADADLVVIEGAGSPAEINLKAHDLVNMAVAREADARVLLVGDIDRGGVFAALVGTMELLDPDERARVGAFIINKFRGDPALLAPGLDFLTGRTGVPVLGVLPHLPALGLADEDSLGLDDRGHRRPRPGDLDLAVIRLPRISNFDDFQPLEHQPGVTLRFVADINDLGEPDLVILPGSKSTIADLAWLRSAGFAAAVTARAARGAPVLGICGGCQMLGQTIRDPHGAESSTAEVAGLGLLPLATEFAPRKLTAAVTARALTPSFLTEGAAADCTLAAYEIHMGQVTPTAAPAFAVLERNRAAADARDGAVAGAVVGTLLHGLFENPSVVTSLLHHLARRRGLAPPAVAIFSRAAAYDRLADAVRAHLDGALLYRLAGLT